MVNNKMETAERVRYKPSFPTKPLKVEVWVLNDDDSDPDYVVHTLKVVFKKSDSEATRIMLEAEATDDGALVGEYWRDIALTRINEVERLNRINNQPLKYKIVEHAE